eukprot:TRINITY_DN9252_c0_g1_i2.p1 TRINITY_DN9252_c0_g1~~TRINITY_DN9252_c0_g1_i2.p1  ORF type:complete len:292 (+),score=53.15 TRINITY_DN9252_c0_g1_i2:61-936(+)
MNEVETMFRAGLKPFGFFITFLQFVYYIVISKVHLLWSRTRLSTVSLSTYAILAGLSVTTMACSNASLAYLAYPTQLIFKSCKLIPVMIGGILIQNKVYKALDYGSSLLLSLGLIVFTLTDASLDAQFDMFGVFLVCLALAADAAIGNVQEKIMKAHGTSNTEMIHFSYMVGSAYLFLFCAATGELQAGLAYFNSVPVQDSYGLVFVFSLLGYVGLGLVLTLIRRHGALAAVTVTNLRKVFSIIISFLVYPKPFSAQYLFGGVFVAAGVAMQVYSKQQKRRKKDQRLPTHV